MKRNHIREGYSLEKSNEGGRWNQKEAIEIAKKVGASKVDKAYSPYVGQYGLYITATPTMHEKLENIYFGKGGYDKGAKLLYG